MKGAFGQELCMAGREAGFEGNWTVPCNNVGDNILGSPASEKMFFCDMHIKELIAAGLVSDPYLTEEEFAALDSADDPFNEGPTPPALRQDLRRLGLLRKDRP